MVSHCILPVPQELAFGAMLVVLGGVVGAAEGHVDDLDHILLVARYMLSSVYRVCGP